MQGMESNEKDDDKYEKHTTKADQKELKDKSCLITLDVKLDHRFSIIGFRS